MRLCCVDASCDCDAQGGRSLLDVFLKLVVGHNVMCECECWTGCCPWMLIVGCGMHDTGMNRCAGYLDVKRDCVD